MGSLLIGESNPLTAKAYASEVTGEALRESFYGRFVGRKSTGRLDTNDAGSLVSMQDELKNSAGDTVTMPLRAQLQGEGVTSGTPLEGREEAVDFRNFSLRINEQSHAVRNENKITQQRVTWNMRDQNRDALKDWFVDTLDFAFFSHLCGDTLSNGNTRYMGNNTITAPTRQYIKDAANNATEEALGTSPTASTDSMTLQDISRLRSIAETARIRPVNIPGNGKHYVLFLHDRVLLGLKTATGSDTWAGLQKAFAAGGGNERQINPLLTGLEFIYDGVAVYHSDKLPRGIDAAGTGRVDNVYRSVLCGAQAIAMAHGQDSDENEFSYREELHDYGRELGSSMCSVYGMAKTVFTAVDEDDENIASTAVDHATVVLSSYAPDAGGSF